MNFERIVEKIVLFAKEQHCVLKYSMVLPMIIICSNEKKIKEFLYKAGIDISTIQVIKEDLDNRQWIECDMRILQTVDGVKDRVARNYPQFAYYNKERHQQISIDTNILLCELLEQKSKNEEWDVVHS